MKAMVLAAGEGRRLQPLTLERPKPTIPVLGRPLLLQILHRLYLAGIDSSVVNLHHGPDAIRELCGAKDNPGLPRIEFSHECEILGTGGGLRHAADFLGGNGPILVHNSDFLADIDFERAFAVHRSSELVATLVLAPARPGYSLVEVDSLGRVLSLAGLPETDPTEVAGGHLFTGCHIINESVLERIPANGPSDMRDVFRVLASERQLGSFLHDGFWWEFGSPELYLEGSLKLLGCTAEKRRDISRELDPVRRIDDAVVAMGPGARLHPTTTLKGRVAVGLAGLVSERVTLEDSVVMPEAWVGPDSRLRRCVVGPGVELPANFHAERELICNDFDPQMEPSPGTRRRDGLLIYGFSLAEAG